MTGQSAAGNFERSSDRARTKMFSCKYLLPPTTFYHLSSLYENIYSMRLCSSLHLIMSIYFLNKFIHAPLFPALAAEIIESIETLKLSRQSKDRKKAAADAAACI